MIYICTGIWVLASLLLLAMFGLLRRPADPTLYDEPEIPGDSAAKRQARRELCRRVERTIDWRGI